MNQLALPLEFEPRQIALEYIRELLRGGYDEDRALEEPMLGATGDPGYEIQRGRIYIPWYMCPERRSYKFSELAAEIRTHTSACFTTEETK